MTVHTKVAMFLEDISPQNKYLLRKILLKNAKFNYYMLVSSNPLASKEVVYHQTETKTFIRVSLSIPTRQRVDANLF